MLIDLINSLGEIEDGAALQSTEVLKKNMALLKAHTAKILKLDGVVGMSAN